MTYQQAKMRASKLAKQRNEFVSVVCEDMDFDEYDTATDQDLETYHLGAKPLVTYGPDGLLW